MIRTTSMIFVLFISTLHAASWRERVSSWLEQEVPPHQSVVSRPSWVLDHAALQSRQEGASIVTVPTSYDAQTLQTLLAGTYSDRLTAYCHLHAAIDNNSLTPATTLLVTQHAQQLHIPRNEQIGMLSKLLNNPDPAIQIPALRIAEKEVAASDLHCTGLCIAGATLSGFAASIYGDLAWLIGLGSMAVMVHDPQFAMLQKKVEYVKALLKARKIETSRGV